MIADVAGDTGPCEFFDTTYAITTDASQKIQIFIH